MRDIPRLIQHLGVGGIVTYAVLGAVYAVPLLLPTVVALLLGGDFGSAVLINLGLFGLVAWWSQSRGTQEEALAEAGRRAWGAFLGAGAILFAFRPATGNLVQALPWFLGLAGMVGFLVYRILRRLWRGPGDAYVRLGATQGSRRQRSVSRPRELRQGSTDHAPAARPGVPAWPPRGGSPVRFDVEELARRLGLEAAELRSARPRYARFTIPKRTGGTREIVAPDPATKALQRRILRRLLARLPVHSACHGFELGRSIVSNAAPHAGREVVIRLDIKDFFRSTSTRRVRRFFRVLGWNREAARILTRLTTLDGGLPQGAPTSPRLANLVNMQLDARLDGLAATFLATYTRYADDLTFSFAGAGHAQERPVIRATRRFLRQTGYELHLGRKLRIRRRHQRQLVTGLVVNTRVALPRSRRRWLRAVEHHIRTGRPATLTEAQLAGWHAFELMVEGASGPAAEPEVA